MSIIHTRATFRHAYLRVEDVVLSHALLITSLSLKSPSMMISFLVLLRLWWEITVRPREHGHKYSSKMTTQEPLWGGRGDRGDNWWRDMFYTFLLSLGMEPGFSFLRDNLGFTNGVLRTRGGPTVGAIINECSIPVWGGRFKNSISESPRWKEAPPEGIHIYLVCKEFGHTVLHLQFKWFLVSTVQKHPPQLGWRYRGGGGSNSIPGSKKMSEDQEREKKVYLHEKTTPMVCCREDTSVVDWEASGWFFSKLPKQYHQLQLRPHQLSWRHDLPKLRSVAKKMWWYGRWERQWAGDHQFWAGYTWQAA